MLVNCKRYPARTMNSISHSQTGIILVVKNFEECVAFYRDLFGLKVMHEKKHGDFRLTCLEFGSSYLMIETEPPFPKTADEKGLDQNPTKLRFNVPNIKAALRTVHAFGLDAHINECGWGSTINLTDPDGNRVGIRDERGFNRDNAQSSAPQKETDSG